MIVGEQINRLNAVKSSIRNSIIAQGVSVPAETPFIDYAFLIRRIEGGGMGGVFAEQSAVIGYVMPKDAHSLEIIQTPTLRLTAAETANLNFI